MNKYPSLIGKKVLVTGASRGIGLEIALAFFKQNAKVTINSRNAETLKSIVKMVASENFLAIEGDATKNADAENIVKSAIQNYGNIDVLVCNLGSGAGPVPGDETLEDWFSSFDVNFWSAIYVIQAAKKSLIESRGSIICISSICGEEVILGAPVTYSVAKAALNAYIKRIARFFGPLGVRINAISPGNMIFEGSSWSKKITSNPDAVQNYLQQEVALQRLGCPDDVAQLALWLSADEGNFCTGSIFTVDGGQVRS